MSFDSSNTDWDKIKIGLKKYETIMKLFHDTDVSKDLDFQRTFNGFYRIRMRSKEFYKSFYHFLESNKHSGIDFQKVLGHFFKQFERLESSFSSKIIATINPNMPIWDSKVLERLKQYGIKKPSSSLNTNARLEETVKTYNEIINWYKDFIPSSEAQEMLKIFNHKIPNANITDVKKIDFILWQTRDEKSKK